jgi:hypothetical protein
VHGTWPRGLFPRLVQFKQWVRVLTLRQRSGPRPFWFEEGSPFLARLSADLRDIPHKITSLPWTGKNSIRARDETAHALAKRLSAEHAEHPEATQLVIAHSHGGNIALRALHLLHQPDGSRLCEADGANPLVITLATPCVEVHHADFGPEPTYVRLAVIVAISWPLLVLAKTIFHMELFLNMLIGLVVTFSFGGLIWWYLLSQTATLRRQNKVEDLVDATRLREREGAAQAERLLIIRAVDDEASLVLAFSTIGNSFITRAIRYIRWIIFGPFQEYYCRSL